MSHTDNTNMSTPLHGYFDSDGAENEPRPCVPLPHPRTETPYGYPPAGVVSDWEGVVHDEEFEALARIDEALAHPERFTRRERPRHRRNAA